MSLMEIEVEFDDGLVVCVGEIDTRDGVMESVDEEGGVVMGFRNGFAVRVVSDGWLVADGERTPLVPGVYEVTDDGLLLDGEPVRG